MATRQLAAATSTRRFFWLSGVAAPMGHKPLRLIAPFSPIAFLRSVVLVGRASYNFRSTTVPAFVNGLTGK